MARFTARGITSIREAGVDGAELGCSRRCATRAGCRCGVTCCGALPRAATRTRRASRSAGMPPANPAGDPYLRLTGVKVFVDGRIADAAIGGAGGPVSQRGTFRMTPPTWRRSWGLAAAGRAGVGCHAVGDAAVRMVLDAYERALSAGLARQPRQLVVEHALDCAPETIRRLAASGVGVSAHPGIVYEFADDVRRYWGEENAARAAPVRDMVSAGVRVAAGSDGDVPAVRPAARHLVHGDPARPPRRADRRGPGPGRAASRSTSTLAAARSCSGPERARGRLRPGMDADLVAFSADPLSCPVGRAAGHRGPADLAGREAGPRSGAADGGSRRWVIRRSWSTATCSTAAAPRCSRDQYVLVRDGKIAEMGPSGAGAGAGRRGSRSTCRART